MKLAIGSYSKALLPSTVVNNGQRSDFVGQNFWYFTFNTNVSIAAACSMSLAILTTLTLSLVTPHPRRCCCCLQLVTMPLCEHPWYGMAHCRQELHAIISSVVVSRYTRATPYWFICIACTLSLDNKFRSRLRITPHILMCIYPITPRPQKFTHSTPSFSTRAFSAPPIIYLTPARSGAPVHCLHGFWTCTELTAHWRLLGRRER